MTLVAPSVQSPRIGVYSAYAAVRTQYMSRSSESSVDMYTVLAV